MGKNKNTKNVSDVDYTTVKEGTDSMGGPVYLFNDAGGYWGEHHKNSGEDIITDYMSKQEAEKWFADEVEKSVWS